MHLREAGDGIPVVLIHQSPGSSKQLEPLMRVLAQRGCHALAPDMPGNSDSEPNALIQPEIWDLATAAPAAVGQALETLHIYGSHTGASIAMEMALAAPDRVQSLTLEGMGLYDPGMQSEVLDRYAHEIRPDAKATHLMKVWHFCRDQFLFWPYYNRTGAGLCAPSFCP